MWLSCSIDRSGENLKPSSQTTGIVGLYAREIVVKGRRTTVRPLLSLARYNDSSNAGLQPIRGMRKKFMRCMRHPGFSACIGFKFIFRLAESAGPHISSDADEAERSSELSTSLAWPGEVHTMRPDKALGQSRALPNSTL